MKHFTFPLSGLRKIAGERPLPRADLVYPSDRFSYQLYGTAGPASTRPGQASYDFLAAQRLSSEEAKRRRSRRLSADVHRTDPERPYDLSVYDLLTKGNVPALNNIKPEYRRAYARSAMEAIPKSLPDGWSSEIKKAVYDNILRRLTSPVGKGGVIGAFGGYAGPKGTGTHRIFENFGTGTEDSIIQKSLGRPFIPDPSEDIRSINRARRAMGALPGKAAELPWWAK